MNTPYNTGKVKIGLYYQRPRYIEEDADMLNLQSYLIHDPARLNKQYWMNKIGLAISVFVLCVVVLKS
jgi:hypothetical protein